jgi:outer membrane protein OmpA-like peptidoglycan-associated protein
MRQSASSLSVFGMWMLLLLGGAASAESVVEVHLSDKVPLGKIPTLAVSTRQDIGAMELDLLRDDGAHVRRKDMNVPRDSKRTFELLPGEGKHRYQGTLGITLPSGDGGKMNLDFTTEVVASLRLSVKPADLDLERHSLRLHAGRPVVKVDYFVVGEDGSSLGKGVVRLPAPQAEVPVQWEQKDGKVLKIRLVAQDADGIVEDLEIVPWSYFIPHQELVFATNRWDILPEEEPKLEESYQRLQEGILRYGKLLDVKLYVAGYTDTVGSDEHNQNLSEQRALSIAKAFRKKGFTQKISYQGFGEKVLLVPTPDETDEPRNRRAEYVLAAEPPSLAIPGAGEGWKLLP